MCHVESNKKNDFVDIFEFSFTFRNFIHFWTRRFSLNFRKLFNLSIFTFCLVNWTYVPRGKCDWAYEDVYDVDVLQTTTMAFRNNRQTFFILVRLVLNKIVEKSMTRRPLRRLIMFNDIIILHLRWKKHL